MTTFVCLMVISAGLLLIAVLAPALWLERFVDHGFSDEPTEVP